MKRLTKAEEQVMQVLWDKEKAFVKEMIAELPSPKPAYNTVSTIIRILESKGFVAHEQFGKAHRYFPLISKEVYAEFSANRLLRDYFENSAEKLFSFFLKEEKLDIEDIDKILKQLKKQKKS